MAGGVDEVDEEAVAVLLTLLLDEGQIGVRHLEVHGDGGGLDGDAALLLVLAGVGGPRLAGLGRGDDAGLGQERVRQGGLAVVHVGDHGHVADVVLLVHDPTDLVDREIHLEDAKTEHEKLHRTFAFRYVQQLCSNYQPCISPTMFQVVRSFPELQETSEAARAQLPNSATAIMSLS